MGLCTKKHAVEIAIPDLLNQTFKNRRTHTLFAVLRNYRESCNLTGRFNPPSANCVTFFREYENMRTVRISVIKFIRSGNFLLQNEYLAANRYPLMPVMATPLRYSTSGKADTRRQYLDTASHSQRRQTCCRARPVRVAARSRRDFVARLAKD